MKIRLNIKGYIDRRSPALHEAGRIAAQERADHAIEAEYRARVRNNWKERARVLGIPRPWLSPARTEQPAMLKRQAN